MERTILHADLNNCYASIECLHRPEIRYLPVAVAGDPEERKGIVLAKNELAKKRGVKTGEVLWQARQKCPGLVVVRPDFPLYIRFSRLFRGILLSYTDQVEPFGIDEAWCDVSGSAGLFGDGATIADQLRERVKDELGITVSVGVSWNKIFAKLGSDYQKPDATTCITRQNYRRLVWPLPVDELCFVGRKTTQKLERVGIKTIGQLAAGDPLYLRRLLGLPGEVLWSYANGQDTAPVARYTATTEIKSVSHSTTCPRDLNTIEEVRLIIYALSERIAERLRQYRLKSRVIAVSLRTKTLYRITRQCTLEESTDLASAIAAAALRLIAVHWDGRTGLRSLGVRAGDLQSADIPVQMGIFNPDRAVKAEALERTVDRLRQRFGPYSIQRAIMLSDPELSGFNPEEDHIVQPISFYRG